MSDDGIQPFNWLYLSVQRDQAALAFSDLSLGRALSEQPPLKGATE